MLLKNRFFYWHPHNHGSIKDSQSCLSYTVLSLSGPEAKNVPLSKMKRWLFKSSQFGILQIIVDLLGIYNHVALGIILTSSFYGIYRAWHDCFEKDLEVNVSKAYSLIFMFINLLILLTISYFISNIILWAIHEEIDQQELIH